MRAVKPTDITAKRRYRARKLKVKPEDLRRWERGEKVPQVEAVMKAKQQKT